MTTLAFFPYYVSDFGDRTSHMNFAETGALHALLRVSWQTPGCRIPANKDWICRRLRATSEQEKEAIDFVLNDQFKCENGYYFAEWFQELFEKQNEKHTSAVQRGRKGAEAKRLKNNNSTSSLATATLKQLESEPELEPEPELDKDCLEKEKISEHSNPREEQSRTVVQFPDVNDHLESDEAFTRFLEDMGEKSSHAQGNGQ